MRPNRIKERIAMLLYIILGEMESNALPTKLVLLLAKPICNHLCFVSKVLLQLYAFDFINYTIRRIYTAHLFPPRQVQCG